MIQETDVPRLTRHHKRAKRGEIERKLAVLEAVAMGKDRTTPIMYHSNLRHTEVRQYLIFLASRRYIGLAGDGEAHKGHGGPIRANGYSRLKIVITEDGIRLLQMARTIRRQLLDEEAIPELRARPW